MSTSRKSRPWSPASVWTKLFRRPKPNTIYRPARLGVHQLEDRTMPAANLALLTAGLVDSGANDVGPFDALQERVNANVFTTSTPLPIIGNGLAAGRAAGPPGPANSSASSRTDSTPSPRPRIPSPASGPNWPSGSPSLASPARQTSLCSATTATPASASR